MERGPSRIRTGAGGFAIRCLTAWLRGRGRPATPVGGAVILASLRGGGKRNLLASTFPWTTRRRRSGFEAGRRACRASPLRLSGLLDADSLQLLRQRVDPF